MMLTAGVGLGPQSVIYCFGMSKMTRCVEKDQKSFESTQQLEHVEFLEFIGRLSFAKFQGSELEEQLNLAQKIEYILDDILPLVGLKRQDPLVEEVSSEESEDDY